jgi:hypothetical protein
MRDELMPIFDLGSQNAVSARYFTELSSELHPMLRFIDVTNPNSRRWSGGFGAEGV